jgi:hypothetical protein
MNRIFFTLTLCLLALFSLAVPLNAPRLAEARAHEAAAMPALPHDATRPRNSDEQALVRQTRADGLSKNQFCREI